MLAQRRGDGGDPDRSLSQGPAAAQQVVALVNGEPITAMDIAQRTKLIQVSTRQTMTRQQVLDELIDEKLKLHVAKRYKLEISDAEVDAAFNNIATRAGNNPQQFAAALQAQGISPEAVKVPHPRRSWAGRRSCAASSQSRFQIRERDIIDKVQSMQKGDGAGGRLRVHAASDPLHHRARRRRTTLRRVSARRKACATGSRIATKASGWRAD